MRSFLISISFLVLLSSCSTTTVYIVRHGEKVNESDTTNLSPAGFARAAALADTLATRGIDSIFSTPYRRTHQTIEPLAKRIGLSITDYPAKPMEAIVDRVKKIRNKTVVVAGHSNTILEIARGLGARPTMAKIESGDFDNLLKVRIHRGPFRKSVDLSEKTYGQPTLP
ncbi:phosphoglycerate mutase family protein [Spirosoma terrae]|uniref:Histidine phosphatase family protein n=1 Tax=Spirosoma terrae TaxID=1968276 RepID=A0A6L9LIP2_9BACT|nr:histidine phosphatase family protein [Spirosoma terrae]NDU98793.1 histidine phosphatase family protein [Spirosoma terrae]